MDPEPLKRLQVFLLLLAILLGAGIVHSLYREQEARVGGQTTTLTGAVHAKGGFLHVVFFLRNHKETASFYRWEIALYQGGEEKGFTSSAVVQGGTGLHQATSFRMPQEEDAWVAVRLTEEGAGTEERIFYLNATSLPISW
jgi:hypothetical protein